MGRIRTLQDRVLGMSFARMGRNARQIQEETGRSRVWILADMVWCALRYGVGYLDYHVFGFAVNRGRCRRTFMTMNHNLALARALNDSRYTGLFRDKKRFNERFNAYLGRAWMDIREGGVSGLARFIEGREAVFAKRTDLYGGQGVGRIATRGRDAAVLYRQLMESGRYLVEEELVQHPALSRLCPASVNTIRIVTLLSGGEAHFLYAFFRMGNGTSSTDNVSSGGMYTAVTRDGQLSPLAFSDKTGRYYSRHPRTGVQFEGCRIPFFHEAVRLCRSTALVEPRVGYVGWDVAVTPEGPVLIEGNQLPGYNMCQNYRHLDPPGVGILPRVRAITGLF